MKHFIWILIFILFAGYGFSEDIGIFSVNLAPRGTVPLGEGNDYFNFGYGASLSGDFSPSFLPLLYGRLEADYEYMPIITKDGLSLITISAGPGVCYSPVKNLSLSADLLAGYYYGAITDGSGTGGGNFAWSGGISVSYDITSAFSIAVSGDYSSKLFLFDGIGITLGTVINPAGFKSNEPVYGNSIDLLESRSPGISGDGLDVENISFNRVFPVLFKHYDDNPVGRVRFFNNESKAAEEVSLSFYVDKYMDNPKQSPVIESIPPGESADFDIYALFSDNVLDITEGTKVSANVIIKYTYRKKETARKYTVSLELYDRNAITWDDDRKAAAFVTAKDPAVLELAKNISGWVKEESPSAIDRNLCIAMGIHNGLGSCGVNYQIDPKTPFTEFSADGLTVDFLQFPRQTLSYSSGDCDDLSILYSALLESVGIETAFVTVPGHIFIAFALNTNPTDAKRTYLKPEDLIFTDDKVWLPVEITLVQDDFLTAWAQGAKQWREYEAGGKARLYPMHTSWTKYQPVGLPGSSEVAIPEKTAVVDAFRTELETFIAREIYPKVERIEKQISRSNNGSKYINRLGVLYARYGLNSKAEIEFSRILRKEEYVPSLINMGNLKFLQQEVESSLGYYQRAQLLEPENPTVLVAIARASHELENYDEVEESYGLLKQLAPELAEQFAYLELRGNEAVRASNTANQKEIVVWDEN